jgi:hypothetical protein
MEPEAFEMVETLDRGALERHPVWTPFRPADRPWILAWGVPPERLDQQIALYQYCGPDPLFPVLDRGRLPARPDLIVAARFTLGATGAGCPGYVLAPHAWGVFTERSEHVFNRGLPAASRRSAERLLAALGLAVAPEHAFPMRYRTTLPGWTLRPRRESSPPPGEPARAILPA